ncbi:hypothetical protein ASG52_25540 [Methylobacterium sp. Leaf456]|uniref:hypothetical protein n=1 Tax=Methylobacterium sp. Leaf456 TaxID=1736382 RepID=UPI0006FD8F07|nr:hypothetical protein [Methylobacterium sp. Leaf456]KQT52089.1 hypothetical protein ASG52_25540 [Methylobacterium sp. Leaf456]
MSKTPRPTLDSLSSRFARKDTPASAAPSPAVADAPPVSSTSAPAETASPDPGGKPDARVQILTRIDAPTRKRLRMIALEQDRTVQDICEEAIRDFVARHSK